MSPKAHGSVLFSATETASKPGDGLLPKDKKIRTDSGLTGYKETDV